MSWKFAANASFFGARRDRFNQFQPDRDLAEKFQLVAEVEGVTGIELKYPRDFGANAAGGVRRVRELLEQHELALSAVNVGIKDVEHFRYGALSARDSAAREHAARLLREGMDVAAELGASIVTTCPLAEGYDYAFQMDYGVAWEHIIGTLRSVVTHRQDVTLVLEYQPHEPYAHILLGDVGRMLHVCAEVDAPNFGANLDVGHAFAAGDNPAEAATLLARKGWLRYMHSNDNTGEGGDWDMISGSVHFWHWLELLYVLRRIDYKGWISADLEPRAFGPVAAYRTNVLMIHKLERLLDYVGPDHLARLLAEEGRTAEVYAYLMESLQV